MSGRRRLPALAAALGGALAVASAAVWAAEPPPRPVATIVELPAALAAEPQRLAAARAGLGPEAVTRTLGPFVLYTDVADARFLAAAGRLVESLPALWRERHGLELGGGVPGVVVVHGRQTAYEAAAARPGDGLAGHAGGGLAVLHAETGSDEATLRLLAHELTHLAAESLLGGGLPPWLGEGLAEDVALAPLVKQRLRPTALDRRSVYRGTRLTLYGPLVRLRPLRTALATGALDLATVLRLDAASFAAAPDRALVYALYGLWLRHLVEDETLGPRLRGFLAAADGVRPGADALAADALRSALGQPWAELEAGFVAFLDRLDRRLGLPAGL